MTIKEAEKQTGLARSNIYFYEKEKLIEPMRNDKNGYRDYSKKDIETIKKIAYLRTLEISIEDIYSIIRNQVSLTEIIKKQAVFIQTQVDGLNKAKTMCEKMLEDGDVSFDELQIEKYAADLPDDRDSSQAVFKRDSVSFLHIWGSLITWGSLTFLCFAAALFSYASLPAELPVQWSGGIATSFMDKKIIFAYPIACMLIRFLFRPVVYAKLYRYFPCGELITEYLLNYLCFIVLSTELFSILFVYGLVKNIASVLLLDAIVLIGLLLAAANHR